MDMQIDPRSEGAQVWISLTPEEVETLRSGRPVETRSAPPLKFDLDAGSIVKVMITAPEN